MLCSQRLRRRSWFSRRLWCRHWCRHRLWCGIWHGHRLWCGHWHRRWLWHGSWCSCGFRLLLLCSHRLMLVLWCRHGLLAGQAAEVCRLLAGHAAERCCFFQVWAPLLLSAEEHHQILYSLFRGSSWNSAFNYLKNCTESFRHECPAQHITLVHWWAGPMSLDNRKDTHCLYVGLQ